MAQPLSLGKHKQGEPVESARSGGKDEEHSGANKPTLSYMGELRSKDLEGFAVSRTSLCPK